MPLIPVPDFIPDAADLGNPGAIHVRNALPGLNSYQPMLSHVPTTDALDTRPLGAIEGRDASENFYQYAGDTAKLYSQSGGLWSDVSVGGGYTTAAGERWEFVRWKETVIATNFSDDPQTITFGGANFADLTTALKFRHLAVVRDFVVVGYTFDGTDGTVRDRVRWCAIGDPTDWTIAAATLSDLRDLSVGGGVQRVIGGEYGVIVMEKSTFRMTFVGSPKIFQHDEVIPGVGALAPGGVVSLGDRVFFPSEHGFMELKGGSSHRPIGVGRVDTFFRNDFDEGYLDRMTAVADPASQKIFWSYPGSGNTAGRPNKMIVYDTALDKWSYCEIEVEMIWRSGGTAYTLEALDDIFNGPEVVTNGTFDTDTDWGRGTGWTISAGVATHASGTGSDLTQAPALGVTENLSYRVTFDVTGRTTGTVTPKIGGTSGTAISADATGIKESITAGSDGVVAFEASATFDGSIDNVEVNQNDIDSFPVTLDSGQFKGGSPLLAGFDTDFKNGNFTGTPYTATFEMREQEFNPGYVSRLKAILPVIDGGSVAARVGHRDIQTETVTYTSTMFPTSTGYIKPSVRGRYHRVELTASGDWKDALGVSIERQDAPKSGRRG